MKKYRICFLALLLSISTVFAVDGQDRGGRGTGTPVRDANSTQPRTPPPPLEEARSPPPPERTSTDRVWSGEAAKQEQAAPAQVRQEQAAQPQVKQEQAAQVQEKEAAPKKAVAALTPEADRAARLKSIGVSVGTSFAAPLLSFTPRVTLPPARNIFFELGVDIGFMTFAERAYGYSSIYPYVNVAFFKPFAASRGGWYLGGGAGYMFQTYKFDSESVSVDTFALNIGTGFVIGNFIDLSYTMHTNFGTASHKISVGFIYRFK